MSVHRACPDAGVAARRLRLFRRHFRRPPRQYSPNICSGDDRTSTLNRVEHRRNFAILAAAPAQPIHNLMQEPNCLSTRCSGCGGRGGRGRGPRTAPPLPSPPPDSGRLRRGQSRCPLPEGCCGGLPPARAAACARMHVVAARRFARALTAGAQPSRARCFGPGPT